MHELARYATIAFSASAVYLFVVIALRLFGKKELAQLSVSDLVFVLLISNAVQNAMVGPDTSLSGGLVAASALFIINYLFKLLLYRFPVFQKLVEGEPLTLIYEGNVNEINLRKARISINELLETIREHGSAGIKDVNLAVLETDGNISILSNDFRNKSVQHRKRRKKVQVQS